MWRGGEKESISSVLSSANQTKPRPLIDPLLLAIRTVGTTTIRRLSRGSHTRETPMLPRAWWLLVRHPSKTKTSQSTSQAMMGRLNCTSVTLWQSRVAWPSITHIPLSAATPSEKLNARGASRTFMTSARCSAIDSLASISHRCQERPICPQLERRTR